MFHSLTPPFLLLEDRLAAGAGGRLYTAPKRIVRCDDRGGLDAAFAKIDEGLDQGLHAAGLFSYELGYALEPKLAHLMPKGAETPLIWMGLFEPPQIVGPDTLDAVFANLGPPPPITGLCSGHDRATHVAKVEEILRLIEAGDVYQVNLTFPYRFHYAGDPLNLYAALRARQPVAHGGFAALGDTAILSVSPELWVEAVDGQATMRPMKGTSARGVDEATDLAARDLLIADPKQRAENLMIVDLIRNDLARVSLPGTVRVPDLFRVETYPSFHALTSTVTGELDARMTLRDRVAALFPCGSIVGAPKIRAGEIIRALEPSARGFYTGALGAISPNRDMIFNVAIRTAVLGPDGAGRYDVGGGIVADSDPHEEYEEACLKARVLTDLTEDFGLIETFRWSQSVGFVRLELHLARMGASARQLGFVFDPARAKGALDKLSASWGPGSADRRVRLELARAGALDITHGPLAASKTVLNVGIAASRLDAGDPFLAHKTTRRGLYERAFEMAGALGLDEVIFANRRGEVAEASRNSVFLKIDGRLVTPLLSSGGLPGVLRQQLIASGEATERVIPVESLISYPVMLGNSLHGLRPARFQSMDVPC